ncbi:MAG: hypothetical protein ACYDIA_07305 [Candidatus Humimicrobiaceae bacterium]
MAGTRVNGSPEALGKMAKNISKFIEAQERLVASLNSDYQSAGQEWKDSKYQQLGDIINQACRVISNSTPTLTHCVSGIQSMKRAMDDYNSSNL